MHFQHQANFRAMSNEQITLWLFIARSSMLEKEVTSALSFGTRRFFLQLL